MERSGNLLQACNVPRIQWCFLACQKKILPFKNLRFEQNIYYASLIQSKINWCQWVSLTVYSDMDLRSASVVSRKLQTCTGRVAWKTGRWWHFLRWWLSCYFGDVSDIKSKDFSHGPKQPILRLSKGQKPMVNINMRIVIQLSTMKLQVLLASKRMLVERVEAFKESLGVYY